MGIFDGEPKFEALRRLREDEGYTGPIDQDGNRVDDMDAWIAEQRDGGE